MALRDVRTVGGMNPQFQAQYDEEQRRMELAKALMAQSQKSPMEYLQQPRSMQSAKLPITAALAPLVQALAGGWQGNQAQKGMAAAQQANAQEISQGKQGFLDAPDKKAALVKLLASQNPALQAYGAEEQKREDERLKTVTELQGKADIPGAISTFLAGDPNQARGVKFRDPEARSVTGPDGKPLPYLVNFGEGGMPKASPFGLPSNIDVKSDAKVQEAEGKDLTAANVKGLEEGTLRSKEAQSSIANASRVIELLQRGAQAGGGQSLIQPLREWTKTFFGVDLPETGLTADMRTALGKAQLDIIRKFAPVTKDDAQRVEKLVGSIDTDPASLPTLMAWQTAAALYELQKFQKKVDILSADSKFGKQYEALSVGAAVPQMLRGPTSWKFLVLQELQREGGDPVPLLKALDPSFNEKEGLPTFDIQGGPITSKADIAKALADKEREKKVLPPGVRRSR